MSHAIELNVGADNICTTHLSNNVEALSMPRNLLYNGDIAACPHRVLGLVHTVLGLANTVCYMLAFTLRVLGLVLSVLGLASSGC